MSGEDFTHSFFHSSHVWNHICVLEIWTCVKGGLVGCLLCYSRGGVGKCGERQGRSRTWTKQLTPERGYDEVNVILSQNLICIRIAYPWIPFLVSSICILEKTCFTGVSRWVAQGPWISEIERKFFRCMLTYILFGKRILNTSKMSSCKKKKKQKKLKYLFWHPFNSFCHMSDEICGRKLPVQACMVTKIVTNDWGEASPPFLLPAFSLSLFYFF